jgi:SAM-dependent methyltransferase
MMRRDDGRFATVNEPFNADRDPARMLSDFGALLSCFAPQPPNRRALDFCSGSGWIAEWLNRMGHAVWAVDVNADAGNVLTLRGEMDQRVDPSNLSFKLADAHSLPFEDRFFGHVCSFDSLHHMHDYRTALSEMARVLAPGGRAVFVEPGSKHSTSPETVQFIREFKADDPTWIERDVVLEEIDALARSVGFAELVISTGLPVRLREYPVSAWLRFRKGDVQMEQEYLNLLKSMNYEARLVFYLQKPARPASDS